MYVPGLSDVLRIQPVPLAQWAELVLVALVLLAGMELYNLYARRTHKG
jgi:hypothetical protein